VTRKRLARRAIGRSRRIARFAVPLALALCHASPAHAQAFDPARADIGTFITDVSRKHGFEPEPLVTLFAQVESKPAILQAIARPAERTLAWDEYRPKFLVERRISRGAEVYGLKQAELEQAQAASGVPVDILLGIVGVETFYGENVGKHRVIDALSTLAFNYPPRQDFFRKELEQYLVMARDESLDPLVPVGSYAGAMGLPQFMPGSYRRYALDFDGSGRADLFASTDDAIGSVANYLARHDWQRGQPVLLPARLDPDKRDGVLRRLDGGMSERRAIAAWEEDGVATDALPPDLAPEPVGVLMLEESAQDASHWLACHNFYVITRYNRSRLYATAVWRLAEAIRAARGTS